MKSMFLRSLPLVFAAFVLFGTQTAAATTAEATDPNPYQTPISPIANSLANEPWDVDEQPFLLYQGNTYIGKYATEEDALNDAKNLPDAMIYQSKPNAASTLLWSTTTQPFLVYQGSHFLGAYLTETDAISEAKNFDNTTVEEAILGQGVSQVWSFAAQPFLVFQDNTFIGAFANATDAVNFAKQYTDTTIQNVKQVANNRNVWSFGEQPFLVYQNTQFIGAFATATDAINYAKYYANTTIEQVQPTLGATPIWSFTTQPYLVFQGAKYLGAFDSDISAIDYAQNITNTTIQQVVEGNVPLQIWTYGTGLTNISTQTGTGYYWKQAQIAAKQLGWNPEFIYAQWELETSHFTSFNLLTNNNIAGQTWYAGLPESMKSTPRPEGGYYIKYSNATEGYIDFVTANTRYSNVKKSPDADTEALTIANDGWAVDPFYADKIIAIIQDNKTYNDYKF